MKTNKLFKNIVWGMTLCGALKSGKTRRAA